ncbi:hypothetical protein BC629DRAFT_1497611 [Irpex lacteus]|nr:hypothetical protein BC629DRAFT_1497611 [Irpex lacteus]
MLAILSFPGVPISPNRSFLLGLCWLTHHVTSLYARFLRSPALFFDALPPAVAAFFPCLSQWLVTGDVPRP